MVIRIELTPEEEARLKEQARRRGASPEKVAADMLRAHLLRPSKLAQSELLPVVDEHGVFHPERMEAVDELFARLSKGKPSLPLEALTREAMYQDHD